MTKEATPHLLGLNRQQAQEPCRHLDCQPCCCCRWLLHGIHEQVIQAGLLHSWLGSNLRRCLLLSSLHPIQRQPHVWLVLLLLPRGMSACWLLLMRGLRRHGCNGRSVLVAALVRLFSDQCRDLMAPALSSLRLQALSRTLPAPMRLTSMLKPHLSGLDGWITQRGCSAAGLRHMLGLLHLSALGGHQHSVAVMLLPIACISWSRLLASSVPLHLAPEPAFNPLTTGHAQPLSGIGWVPEPASLCIAPAAAGV
jgi:hypothetical protein